MEPIAQQKPAPFVDRRSNTDATKSGVPERRQFQNTYNEERPEVADLARAIDQYKLLHRRRFITFEELYDVITGPGYHL